MAEQAWWRPSVAEFLGTFTLCFIGIGAIVSFSHFSPTGQAGANLVGIALAHGLAIAVMVSALGHISGGHFNPAVTIAAMVTRRIKFELGAMYVLFQLLGGVTGAFAIIMTLPSAWWEVPAVSLGTPGIMDPEMSPNKALLIEAILTFLLVIVIFGIGIDARNHMRPVAGLAIGLAVTMDILMGGFLTGAAMNPARWFGPALLTQNFTNALVYLAGPVLGGIAGGLVYDSAYFTPKPAQVPQPPEPPVEAPKA